MIRTVTANPFAGLEGSELLLVKHRAAEIIESEMKARGLSQEALAKLCGMHQPHVSEILQRKLDRFGIDRLNRVLAVFGRRIATHYEIEAIADTA